MSSNMDSVVSRSSAKSVTSVVRSSYDYLAKVIIVGCSNTGKTCLLHRFVTGHFPQESSQTIGVDFSSKFIAVGDVPFKLQLWDTAGQERFRSLTRKYYRGSAGVVLVFDLLERETLYKLKEHWDDVQALARDPSVVLVGNKADLALAEETDPSMVVSDEEVSAFLAGLDGGDDIRYVKVSATTGDHVDEVFGALAESILTKIELGLIDPENQSFGVQYGDIPNWGNTISTQIFQPGASRVVRRKATTLSLVDRTVADSSKTQCYC